MFVSVAFFWGGVASAESTEIQIGHLILDQTQTRVGHEFYERFASLWEVSGQAADSEIIITEQASPRWGSSIFIEVYSNRVYETVLQRQHREMDEMVREGVEATQRYLVRLQLMRQLQGQIFNETKDPS